MVLNNSTNTNIFILDNNQVVVDILCPNMAKNVNSDTFFYIMINIGPNNNITYGRIGALPENGATLLNIGGDYVIQNNQGNITTRFALLH